MPNSEWNRKLDLSAPKQAKTKAKAKTKTRQAGILSDRQTAAHQKAIVSHKRWLTRLKRATNAVKKHQKTMQYYEKLLDKLSEAE